MPSPGENRPRRLLYLSRHLWKTLLFFMLYSIGMLWIEMAYFQEDLTISSDLQAVASLFLGSLMALRLNTSYSKWWEARTLWGRLINEERNLAAYVATLSEVPTAHKEHMRELLRKFPKELMTNLRSPGKALHIPSDISSRVFRELKLWKDKAWIDSWEWSRLALVAESLLQVCGGCERIRNSPLLRSYHLAVLSTIWLYLLAAPLALHNRPWTIPLVMMLAGFFLALEKIAHDVDEPFGTSPDDLPLERLCTTIEATLDQLLAKPGDTLTSG